jgi:hypothetical protein
MGKKETNPLNNPSKILSIRRPSLKYKFINLVLIILQAILLKGNLKTIKYDLLNYFTK